MNTIYLLDHYRETLADDKLAIEILARLYRDGPKTEDELKTFLSFTDDELRLKLTKLYRANFVRLLRPDKWANTNLSEEILAHLGISEVAAKSLLEDQDLPPADLFFLNACIETKYNLNYHLSKQQTALLQNLSRITEVLNKRLNQRDVDRKRIIYAIIVGLDPDIHLLGEQAYCDFVFDRKKETKSEISIGLKTEWKQNFVINCSKAIKDVHNSNKLLFFNEADAESENWETFSIAWVRILNALTTEVSDDGLQSASRVTENAVSKIWHSLNRWLSDIEDLSINLLRKSGKIKYEPESTNDKQALLRWTLWEILRRQSETQHEVAWLSIPTPATEELKTDAKSKYPSLLVSLLLHFKSELIAGEYDEISNTQKENICDLLKNVSSNFEKRLLKSPSKSETK